MVPGIVQLFYAWRVHVLVNKLYFTLPIILGAFTGTALGIKATVGDMFNPEFMEWKVLFEKTISAWMAVSALTDIAFATLLLNALSENAQSRRKTGLVVTDGIVNNAIIIL
ncbi:hypothetical protein HWV62_2346 [Athelia sp. TMB]|nr:hypothetical protein HWV62_2346 [Athelia sp. TMB]